MSSDFQKEYEEILKFAIVTPKFQIASAYGEQTTAKPQQVQVSKGPPSRPIASQDGFNLSTIVEKSFSDSSTTPTVQSDSSSSRNDDVSTRSNSRDSLITTSLQEISRKSTNASQTHLRKDVNSSHGANALERLLADGMIS